MLMFSDALHVSLFATPIASRGNRVRTVSIAPGDRLRLISGRVQKWLSLSLPDSRQNPRTGKLKARRCLPCTKRVLDSAPHLNQPLVPQLVEVMEERRRSDIELRLNITHDHTLRMGGDLVGA